MTCWGNIEIPEFNKKYRLNNLEPEETVFGIPMKLRKSKKNVKHITVRDISINTTSNFVAEQYERNVLKPLIEKIKDGDEEQHVVTAGSIITVTIGLERQGLDTFMGRVGLTDEEDNEAEELDEEDKDMVDEEEDEKEEEKEEEKKKGPVWKKPQQKKKAGKKPGKGKQKSKQKLKAVETAAGTTTTSEVKEVRKNNRHDRNK